MIELISSYRSNHWTGEYVSNLLTHFVGGDGSKNKDCYTRLKKIIEQCELLSKNNVEAKRQEEEGSPANPSDRLVFCTDRRKIQKQYSENLSSNKRYLADVVCFCDIPINLLGIHMAKYGEFGLSFTKEFMVRQGASPVFYIEQNSMSSRITDDQPLSERFDAGENEIIESLRALNGDGKAWNNEGFLAFAVFGFCKFFDSSLAEDNPKNYYYEREWRAWASIGFTQDDISAVIMPCTFKERFLLDFPDLQNRIVTVKDCITLS